MPSRRAERARRSMLYGVNSSSPYLRGALTRASSALANASAAEGPVGGPQPETAAVIEGRDAGHVRSRFHNAKSGNRAGSWRVGYVLLLRRHSSTTEQL